jgi:hypothetical protein
LDEIWFLRKQWWKIWEQRFHWINMHIVKYSVLEKKTFRYMMKMSSHKIWEVMWLNTTLDVCFSHIARCTCVQKCDYNKKTKFTFMKNVYSTRIFCIVLSGCYFSLSIWLYVCKGIFLWVSYVLRYGGRNSIIGREEFWV